MRRPRSATGRAGGWRPRVRLAPLSASEADAMIRDLATFPLLDGYRGGPRADVASLREVVLRVGALAEDLAEIAELDLNPVLVGVDRAPVVDARVRVEPRPGAPRGRPPVAAPPEEE